MANDLTHEADPARSPFVTIIAWVFIVLAGLAMLILTLQGVVFYFMLRNPKMQAAMGMSTEIKGAPEWLAFFLGHPWIFVVICWLLALLTLTAAVGLLRRVNWARILFMVILGLGIAWNIGGMVLQGFFFNAVPDLPVETPTEFVAGFKTLAIASMIGSALFAIAISVLFAWIIKRLGSQPVKAEFHAF
jgi:hypothetical protein